MKWLAKLFMPSAESCAGYAADALAKSLNGVSSDRKAQVAKYATLAQQATSSANTVSKMLEDGTIDTMERDTIQKALKPLFEKVLALI